MYEAHFGLERPPFRETLDPAAYVPLASRESVMRRLRYTLERDAGPGLLIGPPGVGKSLVARRLVEDLGLPAAHLSFPALPSSELLSFLAEELAAPPDPNSGAAGSLRRIRAALASNRARGTRTLVVVDDAHLIEDPSTFEVLRLLLNFTTDGLADLALLLVGGPEIVLTLPPALMDRLGARCVLGPHSDAETFDYLLGRLDRGGASEPSILFDEAAAAALHHAADGLPRRLNRLADLALLIAYAREIPRPDADAVRAAIREARLDTLAA